MTSALSYYDGYRSERLPANLCKPMRLLGPIPTNGSTALK